MICECFEKTKDYLIENGYLNAELENTAFNIDFKTGKTEEILNIPFSYRKKNKAGELTSKKYSIPIQANFCPLCGKELSKD
jgi:hypothetical protein